MRATSVNPSGLDEEQSIAVEGLVDHLNGHHADTVLFLARHLTGSTSLTDAELVSVDAAGAMLQVLDHGDRRPVPVPFGAAVATAAEVQVQLYGLLAAARAADPGGPLTSIEREQVQHAAIPTRAATVTAVVDVGPDIRQITFGGLQGYTPLGPDDFFLVIRPRPGMEHQLDGELSFLRFRDLPPEEAPGWAYYTVRRHRPEAGEIDLWFVLHEHDGAVSGWARRARPGDRVALWGPRQAYEPPPGTTAVLLLGDETGLGAFAAALEDPARTVPVTAIVESPDGAPVVDLPARPTDTVVWIGRDGSAPGTGRALLDAVSAAHLEPEGLYAYGAGESRQVTAVRQHLRRQRGLAPAQVKMVGYWRRAE